MLPTRLLQAVEIIFNTIYTLPTKLFKTHAGKMLFIRDIKKQRRAWKKSFSR